MTQAEMNARKVRILRTLMDENLSTVDLQYFENVRLMILEERQRKAEKIDEETSSNTTIISEPAALYSWQDSVSYALDEVPPISEAQADALKVRLSRFILDEVKTEDDLDEFEIVDYTIRMGDKAPCQYTEEEKRVILMEAIESIAQGKGIPHEEIKLKKWP